MEKKHTLVGIVGPTGSGKSTLARKVLRIMGFLHLEEPFLANPFLARFYASQMEQFAYLSQHFFLLRKWALCKAAKPLLKYFSVSIDTDIRGDRYMYVEALRRMGSLSPEEYELYQMTADALMESLLVPDLLVYCQRDPATIFDRIRERGREIEKVITLEYLQLQRRCLEEWLEVWDGPVFVLDMDKRDITTEEGAAAALREVERVLEVNRFVI